ncbi:MAG: oligosaccharide flippase family protein [Bacteroidales bacterium]|nr:oligosaccharide flippase family protein [Bacteroidales bacterium]
MSQFKLDSPSRRKTVKILAIGNYSVMIIDIIQGLLFVPLYLNFIGERLYGLWLGTGGILAVLAFLDMGMATLTSQRVSREYSKRNYEGISKYFFGGLLVNTAFMSVLFLAGILLSYWLGVFLPNTSVSENIIFRQAFQIALIALILSLINSTIDNTLNALQKPLMGKIFMLTGAFVGVLFVYFMLIGNQPLLAIPIGLLIRSLISFVPNLVYLSLLFYKNNIPFINYDKETIKDYLKLTPNLMLSKFGTSLVGNIEPTLINIFISPEVAVFYSVTKKAGGLIKTLLDRIGGVIYTSMVHLYNDKSKFNSYFIKILNYITYLTILLFSIYILLNRSFVTLWVGEENYLGDFMTILIAGSLFFNFTSNFLSYILSTTGDIKFSSNTVFYESIMKVVLLFLLLKYFGVYGLPFALIVSGVVFSFIYLKRWNKHLLLSRNQIQTLFKEYLIYAITMSVLIGILFLIINYIYKPSLLFFLITSTLSTLILFTALIICNSLYKELFIELSNRIKRRFHLSHR